jgi:hypothetical protein
LYWRSLKVQVYKKNKQNKKNWGGSTKLSLLVNDGLQRKLKRRCKQHESVKYSVSLINIKSTYKNQVLGISNSKQTMEKDGGDIILINSNKTQYI